MKKAIRIAGAGLLLSALSCRGEMLPPVFAFDSPDSVDTTNLAAVSSMSLDEMSAGFWVRFDKLPSSGSPTGFFECTAAKDGRITIRLPALPTQILGDYYMRSRDHIRKREWHHIGVTYSRIQKRATFYLDGTFQWENDNLNMQRLRPLGENAVDPTFTGKVRDFRVWDAALESEAMLPASKTHIQEVAVSVKAVAAEVRASARSPGLKEWCDEITRTADSLAAATAEGEGGRVSVRQLRELSRDAENARRIARESASPAFDQAVGRAAALYVVPATSQEPYLPYDLPVRGKLTNDLAIITAPGEHENGSIVLVALRPLTVRSVVVRNLDGPGGSLPASAVDVKLVKRWFRSGGAWIFYHADRRQRNLTPDLLVNDDDLIKVDELRRRNFLRLNYPGGRIYADVSDPDQGHQHWQSARNGPFEDAKTLQPLTIGEAGRNQQYLFTFSVPKDAKPGLYKGSISFQTTAGDSSVGVSVRVLPVALPEAPSPYGNLDEVYITHMNHFPPIYGKTNADRVQYVKDAMKNIRAHRMNHVTRLWDSPDLAKLALEAGFIPDHIHGSPFENPPDWRSFYPGVPENELTLADKQKGIRAAIRASQKGIDFFAKHLPPTAIQYSIYVSEASWYQANHIGQREKAAAAHALGQRIFAHGWDRNGRWATDVQDMHASAYIQSEDAARWHAAGGQLINYADPFPGAENPMIFRSQGGFQMYKSGLDGQMLHGFLNERTPFNEWAEDFGGDGNYRNFAMVYPQRNGIIYTLAWEGIRAGYDDIRWATRRKQLADANRDSESRELRLEAGRLLVWLENFKPTGHDIDMIRAGIQQRILIMQDAIARHNGIMPPVDRAYRKYLQAGK